MRSERMTDRPADRPTERTENKGAREKSRSSPTPKKNNKIEKRTLTTWRSDNSLNPAAQQSNGRTRSTEKKWRTEYEYRQWQAQTCGNDNGWRNGSVAPGENHPPIVHKYFLICISKAERMRPSGTFINEMHSTNI